MMPNHDLMGVADDPAATLQLLQTLNDSALTMDKIMSIVRTDSWPSNSLMSFGLGLPTWFLPPHYPSRAYLSHVRSFPEQVHGTQLCLCWHVVDPHDFSLVWAGETGFDPIGEPFVVPDSVLPCLDPNDTQSGLQENLDMVQLSSHFFEYRPFTFIGPLPPPPSEAVLPPIPITEDEEVDPAHPDSGSVDDDSDDENDELDDEDFRPAKRLKSKRRLASSSPEMPDIDAVSPFPDSYRFQSNGFYSLASLGIAEIGWQGSLQ